MNDRIKAYLDGLFAGVPLEGEAAALHDELCANCTERYEDLLRAGCSAEEAFARVREGMGDIAGLIAPLRAPHTEESAASHTEDDAAPHFEQAFPVADVQTIEIDMRSASVAVVPADGEELLVLYEGETGADSVPPTITCVDGVLRIEMPEEDDGFLPHVEVTLNSLRDLFIGKSVKVKTAQLTLSVPQGMLPQLIWRGGSGSLRVTGVTLGGADVQLSGGSIRMETDARVRGGVYTLHTTSGLIQCSAAADALMLNSISGSVKAVCDAPRVRAHTISGSVRVEGHIRELDTKSVSGSVHVQLANADVAQVDAHVISGSVQLAIPAEIEGFTLEASSMSGSVRNAFGTTTYGNGATAIRATAMSGSVRIEKC